MNFRSRMLASAALLFCAASLSAQLSHTWVSGSGSDAHTCAFASPCATFQGALAKTAAGGLITAKDAGDFGPVTIAQSVTIDGNNLGSITFSGGKNGIDITAAANVALQNLTLDGLASGDVGIFAGSGGILIVDNCKIMNFVDDGIYFDGAGNLTVENSRIESFMGTHDGIYISANAVQNVVVKNTVIDASPVTGNQTGFYVNSGAGPVTASLQKVTIMDAGNVAVLANSGVTEITGSAITQNVIGIVAQNGGTISVDRSMITANTTGVCSSTSSTIRLDNNDIFDNSTAIGNCGGAVKTSDTNATSGTIAIHPADVSETGTF